GPQLARDKTINERFGRWRHREEESRKNSDDGGVTGLSSVVELQCRAERRLDPRIQHVDARNLVEDEMSDVADEKKDAAEPRDAFVTAEQLLEDDRREKPEQQAGKDRVPDAAMIRETVKHGLAAVAEQHERAQPQEPHLGNRVLVGYREQHAEGQEDGEAREEG